MGVGPSIPAGFQAELERFNPRLRIRWNAEVNLWVVEERGRTDGNWYYVLFWADSIRPGVYKFRPLPETPGPILERLKEIDVARFQRTPKASWKALVAEMDGDRRAYMLAHLSKQKDDTAQSIKDKWRYYIGGKRSFDMGAATAKGAEAKGAT